MVNNNPNGVYTQFSNMIFRILVGIIFTGLAAWGAYINSRVNEVDTIKNDISWIKQELQDIHAELKEQNAYRHNP